MSAVRVHNFVLFACLLVCFFVCLFGWLVGWLVALLFGCSVVWLFTYIYIYISPWFPMSTGFAGSIPGFLFGRSRARSTGESLALRSAEECPNARLWVSPHLGS